MEQRLGEYRDRPSDVQVQAPQKVTDRRQSWEQYKFERERYLEAKAVAMKELHDRQKDEKREVCVHFLRRFPSFGDWLSAQSREDAYLVYRYPGQLLLSP